MSEAANVAVASISPRQGAEKFPGSLGIAPSVIDDDQ